MVVYPHLINDVNGYCCNVKFDGFSAFLRGQGFSRVYCRQLLNYARKYYGLLFTGNLSVVASLPGRRHIMASLSQLSRFLGFYSRFRALVYECGLKWNGRKSEDVFMSLYDNGETVKQADSFMNELRQKADWDVYFQVAYIALLGVRPVEGCNSLKIISEQGLDGYLNREKLVLEHFRFPKLFIRGGKKLFVSVTTQNAVSLLECWRGKPVMPVETLWKVIERRCRLPAKLYLLRRAWATRMRDAGLYPEWIDFCQGRLPASVFLRSYYRPDMETVFSKVRNVLVGMEKRYLDGTR